MKTEKKLSVEEMKQFIEENMSLVPRNQKNKFAKMTDEQKVERINHYLAMKKMWEESAMKSKPSYKVTKMIEGNVMTIEEAKNIINICNEFINNFKQMEIDKLDEEIRKLQEKRNALEE